MSALYGTLKNGVNTDKSMSGHSHLTAHVRGYHIGIEVEAERASTGHIRIRAYRTGGSNNPSREELIAEVQGDE